MNQVKRVFRDGVYKAPVLELYEFSAEQGFAGSVGNDYLGFEGNQFGDGGLDREDNNFGDL